MPGINMRDLSTRITSFFRTGQDVRQTGEQNRTIRLAPAPSLRTFNGEFTGWFTKGKRDDVLQMLEGLAKPSVLLQKRNYNTSGGAIWVPHISKRSGEESKEMLRDWMRNVSNLLKEGELKVSKGYLKSDLLRPKVEKMLASLVANDKSFHVEDKYIRVEGVNEFPLEILHELASATREFLSSSE